MEKRRDEITGGEESEKKTKTRRGEEEEGGSKVKSQQPLLPLEPGSICCQLLSALRGGRVLMRHVEAGHLHKRAGPRRERTYLSPLIHTQRRCWESGGCCHSRTHLT